MPKFAANLTMLFGEQPFLDRFAAAKAAGFSGVEYLFPYDFDKAELREQLLALSDLEQTFSYCLLDTPIAMFNYVAHVRLLPVTDGDRTFWHWESRFTTRPTEAAALTEMVSEQIYQAGFDAIRRHLLEAP